MNFPIKRNNSNNMILPFRLMSIIRLVGNFYNKKRGSDYLRGFHTSRNLQWTLSGAAIPYSLTHGNNIFLHYLILSIALVIDEGWLIGDETGNIWSCNPENLGAQETFEGIVELQSGVSEIAPLDRSKILVGEMRGNVTKIDLNNLCEETVLQVKGILHRAPIKCIRWQPSQSDVFATAGQDGSVFFSDLRCPDSLISSLTNPHQLCNPLSKSRSTMTGLVFNPLRPDLFYTTGTPDTCVRLWDMRKLSSSKSKRPVRTSRKSSISSSLVEEFSTITTTSASAKKHRSSVALTIDSIGSRLFLSTSNDNIFEFVTNNSELGPIASYTAPGFTSCSFFSNLSIDPSDRFLLTGSSNGQAFIWDTTHDSSGTAAYELPVCAQLEVSKSAWANGKKGSLDAQIACISDDLTFSLFNWGLNVDADHDEGSIRIKRATELIDQSTSSIPFKEIIHKEVEPNMENLNNDTQSSNVPSIPSTPIRKRPTAIAVSNGINTQSPNSANKSILDFFPRSPHVLGQ